MTTENPGSKNPPMTAQPQSRVTYKITPEEMWSCMHGSSETWGIEGYEVPKKYYDYHQVKWYQEREKILNQHKRVWPPEDWPKDKENDKKIPPKRPNFLDAYIKWANSFNDPKRSEEVKQNLESRGTFKPLEPKAYPNLRERFLKNEKEKKEKMANIPQIQEWKQQGIENAKTRLDEANAKKKTQWEKDKERYTKEKPQWPRCDRVTIVADAEYVGEQIPFYNTFKKEGEEVDKNKLFWPSKTATWRSDPAWKFMFKPNQKLPNEQMQTRDSNFKEKIDNFKSGKNISDNDLLVDVVKSYNTVKNRGRYPVTFHKPFDYANTEQYKSNKEQFPDYTPGPEYYWKNVGLDTNERPNQVEEEKEINGKTRKIYYMNHQRTDFREYKPMRKSVY